MVCPVIVYFTYRPARMFTWLNLLIALALVIPTATMPIGEPRLLRRPTPKLYEMQTLVLLYEDASEDMLHTLNAYANTTQGYCTTNGFKESLEKVRMNSLSLQRFSGSATLDDWVALSIMVVRQEQRYSHCPTSHQHHSHVARFVAYSQSFRAKYLI